MRIEAVRTFWRGAAFIICATALGACASTPRGPARATGTVFYPPPPVEPRVQFLTSINDMSDFRRKQSNMARFILGKEEQDISNMAKPYGVAMHDGAIYVCDTLLSVVHVFDLKTRQYSYFGRDGRGRLKKPINITFGPDGRRYVADIDRGQIVVFDSSNQYVREIGNPETSHPSACAIVGDELFLVDVNDSEVERWDLISGRQLGTIGEPGTEDGDFARPTNIDVDEQGRLYVSDTLLCRVQIFDRDGTFLQRIGVPGDMMGQLAQPKGVAVDPNGLIYVVDTAFDNVQIFDYDKNLYLFFGGAGLEPGNLALPAGIAISTDGLEYFRKFVDPSFVPEYLVIVTSQFGGSRINIYAKGHVRDKE